MGLRIERDLFEHVTITLPTDPAQLQALAGAKMYIDVDYLDKHVVCLHFDGPMEMAVLRGDAKRRSKHDAGARRQRETRD